MSYYQRPMRGEAIANPYAQYTPSLSATTTATLHPAATAAAAAWMVGSTYNEMPNSNQHNVQIYNLSWRRLHLSKAKLKASSRTSALLSGFAMVAMVEVQLDSDLQPNTPLLIAFAVCTTLLVAVHMLALMISTCILPHIEAVCNIHGISAVSESPHEKMHYYIETAWAFSTVFGILLFLCEIALLCWVKFHSHQHAAKAATGILVPVVCIFIAFTINFYLKLVGHKYERSETGLRELEDIFTRLESGDQQSRPTTLANSSIIDV